MIKRLFILGIVLFQSTVSFPQSSENINLLSNLIFPVSYGELNDIWGYSDGMGNEYALVGLENGVAVVDVTNPSLPVEVFYAPGVNNFWRDLKVWDNHVYITNEANDGLMIIDLSNLPGTLTSTDVSNFTGNTFPFITAHNLYIDENGICYVMGSRDTLGATVGTIILDLTNDPKNPVELGVYTDFYLHDGMVRGDTLWGAAINNGFFAVIDVSDKANPITLATHSTPNFFTHNCWISDDGETLFTTDEVNNAFVSAFDVSDLSNITELDRIQSSPGENVTPHNTYFINGYLVTSYYVDGVTIHDVADPSNMIEIGHYDTSPTFSGSSSNGCWGVYPYLPSGIIIASDIENGLFVLDPNYSRGTIIKGNVTNSATSDVLDGVLVELFLFSMRTSTTTDLLGDYEEGVSQSGNYDIIYSKFGFESDTIFNLTLSSGDTVVQDVQLNPLSSFTLQGQVLAANTTPIPNASILVANDEFSITTVTDTLGNFSIPAFFEGIYDVFIGKWGYLPGCLPNQNLNPLNVPYAYELDEGYADNFMLDLGWIVTSSAITGEWEIASPIGTSLFGLEANPGTDSPLDCGDKAYVTGNNGGNFNNDDVDQGETVLVSPVFDLSAFVEPYLFFDRWFFNSFLGNDSLVISLSNGVTSRIIDFADTSDVNSSSWVTKSFQLSTIMPLTENMVLNLASER